MKWGWEDVQALPADVYRELVAWLVDEDQGDEDVIDMDALDG